MSKIKLFVDAHVFDGIPQGTVTYLAGLYSELVKDPRFQLFVGSNDRESAVEYLGSDSFTHVNYNTHSKTQRLLFVIPKALKKYRVDYAHFQYISPLQKPCKYIVTIHDLLFLEFPNLFPVTYRIKNSILFYISGKRADILATVSEHSRLSIHRYFNIPLQKISVTPNAISLNLDDMEQIEELKGKKFILYVSRIEPRKNQAILLEIWKELKLYNDDIGLVIVGAEGLHDAKLMDHISALSPIEQDHFHWLKEIPQRNLVWLYKNCSLFVFPSIAEGFGIPPLEAAYCGAKVLCSRSSAMDDFKFFKEFTFSPENKEEFKQKLRWALSNEFPYQFVRNEIQNKYNWERVSRNFATEIIKNYESK